MPAMIRPSQPMQGLFCMTPRILDAAATSRNRKSLGFSFINLTPGSAAPLDIDPHFSFLTEQPGMHVLLFRDSCRGLILFEHRVQRFAARLGYIVCNPTTKQWQTVPACGSPTLLTYPYLAFDPAVSSHFRLVQFQVKEDEGFLSVHTYSSETGNWSDNQIDHLEEGAGQLGWRQFSFNLADSNPQCPFVNGFMHLIVWDQGQMKIVALDVHGKATRLIPVPAVGDRRQTMSYFGESQGHLQLVTQEIVNAPQGKYKMSIWVLQDYAAQGWVLKDTLHTHEAFGEDIEFEVVDFHQDRNVVYFTHHVEHELVAYDMDRKEVSLVATFDAEKKLLGTARYVPCTEGVS